MTLQRDAALVEVKSTVGRALLKSGADGLFRELLVQMLSLPGGILSPNPKALWSFLALAACDSASGGNWQKGIAVAASVECLARSMDIFDDVEDGQVEQYSDIANADVLTNCASALAMTSIQCLLLSDRQSSYGGIVDAARIVLNGYCVAASGQHRDLSSRDCFAVEEAIQVASQKSGKFAAAVCSAGAAAGGADAELIEQYHEFGFHLGLVGQMADDITDFAEDLRLGQQSVPVAYYRARCSSRELSESEARAGQVKRSNGVQLAEQPASERAALNYTWLMAEIHRRRAVDVLLNIERAGYSIKPLAGLVGLSR